MGIGYYIYLFIGLCFSLGILGFDKMLGWKPSNIITNFNEKPTGEQIFIMMVPFTWFPMLVVFLFGMWFIDRR